MVFVGREPVQTFAEKGDAGVGRQEGASQKVAERATHYGNGSILSTSFFRGKKEIVVRHTITCYAPKCNWFAD